MRTVLIVMEVDTDDPREAVRIVSERARLSWGNAKVVGITSSLSNRKQDMPEPDPVPDPVQADPTKLYAALATMFEGMDILKHPVPDMVRAAAAGLNTRLEHDARTYHEFGESIKDHDEELSRHLDNLATEMADQHQELRNAIAAYVERHSDDPTLRMDAAS